MKRTGLIRLGGLATMVGAVSSYATIWSPEWLSILQLSVMVFPAIAALHALQRERYGLPGALASLASFVGLVLIFVSWPLQLKTLLFLNVGVVLATVGLLALGLITITERVLPWWCGAALIVGSPLGAALGMVFLWPLGLDETAFILPLGMGWMLVGFAIFRAGARQTERPSRVR
jgi:hypothetical protein